ncbi:MAG: NTP transferase domain-containing protein [Saprospiraceae bacterium]|nr:NTP transferase domain-containing protein [Saprospiraceae bacterium]
MYGLILAGGQSSRMGQPKSLISYHGKPQYLYLQELLERYCEAVYISCKPEQEYWFSGCPTLPDNSLFGDIGPMTGVLSAFEVYDGPWLIVGCDYPYLRAEDLEWLIRCRDPEMLATVFEHPERNLPEPLIGVYEADAGAPLREWHDAGQQSLRRFLEFNRVEKVAPLSVECLRSVDDQEGKERFFTA